MRKTKKFWISPSLYFICNVAAFYFYTVPGSSATIRSVLALFIVFSFWLFAVHFYIYKRKNSLLVARLKEYCRKVEADLEKALDSGQKKSKFIRNAYHEVRGQFWGVFVITRVLTKARQKGDTRNMNKMLTDLSNGCHNMQLLLTNILEYAKYESGISERPHYEAVDLRRNIAELIDIAQYAAGEKNIRIESYVTEDIPDYVACDRIKINQVMTNLINNAIKFSTPDSSIVVHLHKDTDRLRISIKDHGKGIPPAQLPYIFDAFVTERSRDNNTEGMGLGLYITRQLVTVLQGEINVDSKENAGSCFTVHLPITPFERLSEINYCPSAGGFKPYS